jgi:hypothetical protein
MVDVWVLLSTSWQSVGMIYVLVCKFCAQTYTAIMHAKPATVQDYCKIKSNFYVSFQPSCAEFTWKCVPLHSHLIIDKICYVSYMLHYPAVMWCLSYRISVQVFLCNVIEDFCYYS